MLRLLINHWKNPNKTDLNARKWKGKKSKSDTEKFFGLPVLIHRERLTKKELQRELRIKNDHV